MNIEFIKRVNEEIELLHRHLRVLFEIMKDEEEKQKEGVTAGIGIMKLSKILGIPEHRVRYSLRVLEKEGLIIPTAHGAIPTTKAKECLSDMLDSLDVLSKKINELISYMNSVQREIK